MQLSDSESSISYLTKDNHTTRKTTQSGFVPVDSSQKKRFNIRKSQLDQFNIMSNSLAKYRGNQSDIISENDSCDVSASMQDSVI